MTCEHPNSDGIDGADMDDPYKVWVCGTCHHRFTEAGGDLEEADYPIELAHVLHSADGTNMAAFHELTGDKRDAYLNMARVAREHIVTAAKANALRAAADEFATGERVMERCTRGLVAAWLRDRAHLIESGERS